MMPKQYVAVQFRLKVGKLSIAVQGCPTTCTVTPRLSLFQMMASSAPISWFLFFPHHLLKHHINVFMVNVPFPLILLIQKSTALTSKLPLSLKSFAQNLQT